jgi:hypothetical protein
LARLINSSRVRKVICSYPRSSDDSAFLKAYRAKSLELVPPLDKDSAQVYAPLSILL